MSEYYYHCVSSAQKFGGQPEDYLEVHRYLDRFKAAMPDFRHRAMTHHSEGIWEAIRFFGDTITISTGAKVPVKAICESENQGLVGRGDGQQSNAIAAAFSQSCLSWPS